MRSKTIMDLRESRTDLLNGLIDGVDCGDFSGRKYPRVRNGNGTFFIRMTIDYWDSRKSAYSARQEI